MSTPKRPAMGRGLSALLQTNTATSSQDAGAKEVVSGVFEVAVADIEANPKQPRVHFEPEHLQELAASISALGIVQPLTVRRLRPGKYQIISGERRFRAAQLAGLEVVPVYVRLANDQEMLEMALVENIQRRDLDAMEVALSYARLMEECDMTQQQVSDRVGKERSTVANYIGLLKLSPLVQAGLRDREISMGHARALVGVTEDSTRDQLYHQCVRGGWSVRQLESAVRGLSSPKAAAAAAAPHPAAAMLAQKTGLTAKVVQKANGSGTITLTYKSDAELQAVLKKFS
ncbi:MAG: ParB/RepB/Spo0J family partition protein [Schleiferiaceae bacterium]|jgi:ParB family transcriptional regulator, chromosome partitioning protein